MPATNVAGGPPITINPPSESSAAAIVATRENHERGNETHRRRSPCDNKPAHDRHQSGSDLQAVE